MNPLELFSELPLTLTIPMAPAVKVRHRTRIRGGKIQTYKDPDDLQREQVTQVYMRKLMAEHRRGGPFRGPLALACVFYMPDGTRRDIDNLLKHIMDAGNKILYNDDSQIVTVAAYRHVDRSNPRTELMIGKAAFVSPWMIGELA